MSLALILSFEPSATAAAGDVRITALTAASSTATITFTATGSTEYSLDGGGFIASSSPIALAGLSTAQHTVTIRLVADTATSAAVTWTVASSAPVFPVFANATTAESIRDRAIAIVAGLTPRAIARSSFHKWDSQGDGDFLAWSVANPAAGFRRYQVREVRDEPPQVSNTDYEERKLVLNAIVAYPQDARAGRDQAMDRDDIIEADFKQLDFALGIYARANFSPPNPDAMPTGATKAMVRQGAVDFLVVELGYTYRRLTS